MEGPTIPMSRGFRRTGPGTLQHDGVPGPARRGPDPVMPLDPEQLRAVVEGCCPLCHDPLDPRPDWLLPRPWGTHRLWTQTVPAPPAQVFHLQVKDTWLMHFDFKPFRGPQVGAIQDWCAEAIDSGDGRGPWPRAYMLDRGWCRLCLVGWRVEAAQGTGGGLVATAVEL